MRQDRHIITISMAGLKFPALFTASQWFSLELKKQEDSKWNETKHHEMVAAKIHNRGYSVESGAMPAAALYPSRGEEFSGKTI